MAESKYQQELKQLFFAKTPETYDGFVFVWDLDKTYLATNFNTLFQLLKTAFEKPIHKKNIPGAKSLLQELQKKENTRTVFLSASPEQMRFKISEKLILDEVKFDLLICKNQLDHIMKMEFSLLREQIGYKLRELLLLYKKLPHAKFLAFGDDREHDATIYSLFEDVTSQQLKGIELVNLLVMLGVKKERALEIAWIARSLPPQSPLMRTFIFLESSSDYFYYQKYGSKFLATQSYLQSLMVLVEINLLTLDNIKFCLDEINLERNYFQNKFAKEIAFVLKENLVSQRSVDFIIDVAHQLGYIQKETQIQKIKSILDRDDLKKRVLKVSEIKSDEKSTTYWIKHKYMDEISLRF